MAKLIVKEGPSKSMEYELGDEVKVVGRDRTNDIRINHALVSRNHAQFFKQGNGFAVRDLESKNGTFVNNSPLTPGVAKQLAENDQVRIGPTTFAFVADAATVAVSAAVAGAAVAAAAGGAAPAADGDSNAAGPSTRVLEVARPLFEPAKATSVDELRAGQVQLLQLLDASKEFAACHDQRSVHQTLLSTVTTLLGPARSFLFRMSENNSALVPAGQYLAAGESPGQPLQAARLAVAQAIRDRGGVIRTGQMTAEQTGGQADTRVQLAAPLLNNGALMGVVYVDAKEPAKTYKLADLRLLVALAGMAAETLGRQDGKKTGGGGGFSSAAVEQMRREAALIGQSPVVASLRSFAAKAAGATEPILLWGPAGTGKLHLARLIHLLGHRAGGPLVVINGPALPKSTTESEVFGQEVEGMPAQPGRVEWADGGTLVIDQLAEMSATTQERLHLLVTKGQFQRMGSENTQSADVRVIITSNTDPAAFAGQRLFSQPLLTALQPTTFEVPGLAARKEDVPLLAEHFLQKCRAKADRKIRGFSDEALAALQAYSWPGNLEELHLAVHSAVFFGSGREIGLGDLPEAIRAGGNGRAPASTPSGATPVEALAGSPSA